MYWKYLGFKLVMGIPSEIQNIPTGPMNKKNYMKLKLKTSMKLWAWSSLYQFHGNFLSTIILKLERLL